MNNDYIFLTLISYLLPSAYSSIITGGYSRSTIDTALSVSNIINVQIDTLRRDLIKTTLANLSENDLKEYLYNIPEIKAYCDEYETNLDDIIPAIKQVADYEISIVS